MGCASSSQVQALQEQIEALKEQQENAQKDVLGVLEQVKILVSAKQVGYQASKDKVGLKVEHVEISKEAASEEDNIQAKIEKKQERLKKMAKQISDLASPKAQTTAAKPFPRSITLKLQEIEATVANLTSPKQEGGLKENKNQNEPL